MFLSIGLSTIELVRDKGPKSVVYSERTKSITAKKRSCPVSIKLSFLWSNMQYLMDRFCILLSLLRKITKLEQNDRCWNILYKNIENRKSIEYRKNCYKILFLHLWTTHWTRTYTQLE